MSQPSVFPAPRRRLVLLHDGWGHTPETRAVTARFEGLGFDVEVPDLFAGKSLLEALAGVPRQLATGHGRIFDIAASAVDRASRDAAVAVFGAALGAAVALRMPLPCAVVAAYGHAPSEIRPRGPILGIYGAADRALRSSGRRLANHPRAEVAWYDGAGHSFLADPAVAMPVRRPWSGPHASAEQAWEAIGRFVMRHTAVAA